MRPIPGLSTSVSYRNDPDTVREMHIKESKREVLEAKFLHAGNVWRRWKPLWSCQDRFEASQYMPPKPLGKSVSTPFPIKSDRRLQLRLRL